MKRGIGYAVAAYVIWGLLPLYWHALSDVPALLLIAHRVIWSCALLVVVIAITRQSAAFRTAVASWRVFGIYSIAAGLISVNWFTYIWAVNAGFVVETSLGYFINPLISVVFGVVLLRERLRPAQWAAVGIAASGVVYLTWVYGELPWIALTLAITFALYGLVKKLAPLNSVQGLALETGMLFAPALVYLLVASAAADATQSGATPLTWGLLVGTGLATTVPLLLFSSAARRIPLLWVGVLQYIAPTIQFLLGVLVFHEPMTVQRLAGFAAVWLALAVFAIEGVIAHRASLFPATTG